MIHQALSVGGVDWLPPLILLHCGQFTGGVHPPNQFVPEIVSPLPCSHALVRHTLLIVYFFKEVISFMASLDKCHTSVFNALITIVSSVEDSTLPMENTYCHLFFIIVTGDHSFQHGCFPI